MTSSLSASDSTVNAFPAKTFFVDMLIRDIDLKDSILDLLDNCVDGAMRMGATKTSSDEPPYKDCWAKITFDESSFLIEDNCGGIPIHLAKNSAFRLGRVDKEIDRDIPTVGVYGIGMKRAIFKLGRNAVIESRTENERFTVAIDRDWMENDSEWTIPILIGHGSLESPGTRIRVTDLRDGVPRLFSDETDFVRDLGKTLSAHYALIIEKGFSVWVNGEQINATQMSLLVEHFDFKVSTGIMPYVYHLKKDDLEVSVVVGFYRNLPDEAEVEESLEGRPTSEQAGITVVCNDRVVIYADKTRLTGWGESTVPQYHTQFVSIAGLASFLAKDASLLPVTTTKRGLDGNSELYLEVKEHIREGLKFFTDFTNRWKRSSHERQEIQRTVRPLASSTIAFSVPKDKQSRVVKGQGGWKFKPQLPLPYQDDPMRQVRFSRLQTEISSVADYMFDDPARSPGEVGAKCFDDVLARTRK